MAAAAAAATADIFGSFGWSLESRNEHKSILRHARKRVEDRTWAGFSPLFFSASAPFVGTERARGPGDERDRRGGGDEKKKDEKEEGRRGSYGEENGG